MKKSIKILVGSILLLFIIFLPIFNSSNIIEVEETNNKKDFSSIIKIVDKTTVFIIKQIENNYKNNKKQIIKEEKELIKKEEIKTNYSNKIQVLVTENQREKVDSQLAQLDKELKMLAKVIYREARGINPTAQKAAVVWCILNRVDNGGYGKDISSVITAKHQFAWVPNTPVKNEFYNLSKDVVTRWLLEKQDCKDVGRVLPDSYLFFAGRNGRNYFRQTYKSKSYWNWSLPNPYKD